MLKDCSNCKHKHLYFKDDPCHSCIGDHLNPKWEAEEKITKPIWIVNYQDDYGTQQPTKYFSTRDKATKFIDKVPSHCKLKHDYIDVE